MADAETSNEKAGARRRMSKRESVAGTPFDVSYHPGKLVLYCRPRQRQRWGDTQVLPRVNYGDLFFDLFFVAAAYNTSNILVDSPSGRGIAYFLATFLAVMGLWLDKCFYDARFVVFEDFFHRLKELATLVVLASAVLHIRTIDVMANGEENPDTFVFCLIILIGNFLTGLRYLEVYFMGIGQPVIRGEAKRWLKMTLPYFAVLLVATALAGVKYYGSSNSKKDTEHNFEENGSHNDDISHNEDGYQRSLAGSSTSYHDGLENYNYDVPIYLVLAGIIFKWIYLAIDIRFCFPGGGRHKECVVPINVDFTIHRNGEWNMLMLGESILSLLIVDVPSEDKQYYATFYSGLLTVILLQYLHFRSQPGHADGHALRRNKDAGVGWTCFHMIYSAALIAVGAAFTLMVLEFTYDDYHQSNDHRFLAGGGGSRYEPEERRQRTAHLFCISLATVWFCLDVMTLFHLGIKTSHNRCQCSRSKKFNVKGIILVVMRAGLLFFMATLSQYETHPENLAFAGLMGVLLQLVLRKLGTKYLSAAQIHALENEGALDPEKGKWPNVTHAQAHSPQPKEPSAEAHSQL